MRTSVPNLPNELILEICCYLPVKSIIRFNYLIDLNLVSELEKIPRPFPTRISLLSRIFGSCNGLLAVHYDNFDPKDPKVALWNPSMRQFRYIPNLKGGFDILSYDLIGFGYNAIEDDYEVVKIKREAVMIYSLKKNSWTQTTDYPYGEPCRDCSSGAYMDGKLHWISEDGALELWTILQYGVKESWTKVTDSDQMLIGYSDMKGITLSTYGKKIAIDDCGCSTPVWFDTEMELAEFFDIEGAPSHYTAVAYLETPVAVFPPFHS
ncbi:hypothetical protein GQ457_08G004090 [Hibiscus cannabinus]